MPALHLRQAPQVGATRAAWTGLQHGAAQRTSGGRRPACLHQAGGGRAPPERARRRPCRAPHHHRTAPAHPHHPTHPHPQLAPFCSYYNLLLPSGDYLKKASWGRCAVAPAAPACSRLLLFCRRSCTAARATLSRLVWSAWCTSPQSRAGWVGCSALGRAPSLTAAAAAATKCSIHPSCLTRCILSSFPAACLQGYDEWVGGPHQKGPPCSPPPSPLPLPPRVRTPLPQSRACRTTTNGWTACDTTRGRLGSSGRSAQSAGPRGLAATAAMANVGAALGWSRFTTPSNPVPPVESDNKRSAGALGTCADGPAAGCHTSPAAACLPSSAACPSGPSWLPACLPACLLPRRRSLFWSTDPHSRAAQPSSSLVCRSACLLPCRRSPFWSTDPHSRAVQPSSSLVCRPACLLTRRWSLFWSTEPQRTRWGGEETEARELAVKHRYCMQGYCMVAARGTAVGAARVLLGRRGDGETPADGGDTGMGPARGYCRGAARGRHTTLELARRPPVEASNSRTCAGAPPTRCPCRYSTGGTCLPANLRCRIPTPTPTPRLQHQNGPQVHLPLRRQHGRRTAA